jgi:hypothetical protein
LINWNASDVRHLLWCCAKVFNLLNNLRISQIRLLQHVEQLAFHHSTNTLLHLLNRQASDVGHLLCCCTNAVQLGGDLRIG